MLSITEEPTIADKIILLNFFAVILIYGIMAINLVLYVLRLPTLFMSKNLILGYIGTVIVANLVIIGHGLLSDEEESD